MARRYSAIVDANCSFLAITEIVRHAFWELTTRYVSSRTSLLTLSTSHFALRRRRLTRSCGRLIIRTWINPGKRSLVAEPWRVALANGVRVDQPPGAKPMVSTSGRESWPSIGPDHASFNTVALAGDQRGARLAAGRTLYPCPQMPAQSRGRTQPGGCPRRAVRTIGPSDLLELFGNCAGLPVLRTLRPKPFTEPALFRK
jgi:hypothetical protein